MPSTSRTSNRGNQRQAKPHSNTVEDVKTFVEDHHDMKEMTHDLTQYVVDYARQNPGTAALTCLGMGFVLGWKLKPW
jgi:hypothetical protein